MNDSHLKWNNFAFCSWNRLIEGVEHTALQNYCIRRHTSMESLKHFASHTLHHQSPPMLIWCHDRLLSWRWTPIIMIKLSSCPPLAYLYTWLYRIRAVKNIFHTFTAFYVPPDLFKLGLPSLIEGLSSHDPSWGNISAFFVSINRNYVKYCCLEVDMHNSWIGCDSILPGDVISQSTGVDCNRIREVLLL